MTGRPRRCHYATDPATRPDCAITAAIGYGPTALCRPCDTRRSTLDKGHPSRPLAPTGPIDPLQLIADAHTELRRAERELAGAAAGLAHGDLSAYNLLVHNGRLVVIDIPQAIDVVANPRGHEFLRPGRRERLQVVSSTGLPRTPPT